MKDANIPGQLSVPALRGGTDIGKMGGLSRFSGLPRLRRTRVKAGSFPACRSLTTRAVAAEKPEFFAHLRFAQPRALGRKVSDEFTVGCAAGTIARSTDAWMKAHGGKVTSLMASPLQESFAWKHIEVHASATTPKIIDDLIGNQYFSASWLSQPIGWMRMTGDWDRVPMSAIPPNTAVWMRLL